MYDLGHLFGNVELPYKELVEGHILKAMAVLNVVGLLFVKSDI